MNLSISGSEIYPIGKLRYPKGTIWLIASNMDPGNASVYAILLDENCELKDELMVASHIFYMSSSTHMNSSSYAVIKADGTITVYEHSASYSVEENASTSQDFQRRYRVDFERHKFVAL